MKETGDKCEKEKTRQEMGGTRKMGGTGKKE